MYENRILAFIDILGFSDSIRKTMQNGIENNHETDKISRLFDVIKLSSDIAESVKDIVMRNRIVNHFSDTIVISYSTKESNMTYHLLADIIRLYLFSIAEGFLLRGAIVSDKLYHTPDKVFGPALVRAYEMEKTSAFYPRIIIDQNTYENYCLRLEKQEELSDTKRIVKKDFDGQYYIDFFDDFAFIADNAPDESQIFPNLEFLEKIIISMEKIDNISINAKYLWLKEKYDLAREK